MAITVNTKPKEPNYAPVWLLFWNVAFLLILIVVGFWVLSGAIDDLRARIVTLEHQCK